MSVLSLHIESTMTLWLLYHVCMDLVLSPPLPPSEGKSGNTYSTLGVWDAYTYTFTSAKSLSMWNCFNLPAVLTVCLFAMPSDSHASMWFCTAVWSEQPDFTCQKSAIWTPNVVSSSLWCTLSGEEPGHEASQPPWSAVVVLRGLPCSKLSQISGRLKKCASGGSR